jgi:hypothetical protein
MRHRAAALIYRHWSAASTRSVSLRQDSGRTARSLSRPFANSAGLSPGHHRQYGRRWSAAGPCAGPMGRIGSCGSCRCCRRPPRSCTPSGWEVTWSGSPTNATGHPRPAPCRSCRALPCRRPSNRPRSTGWSARVSAAASRSTGSTPPPSGTCAPTWSWPRTCARSARSPPGTSTRPWTSWAARPRSSPWTPAPWTRSRRACCRSARPPGAQQRAEEVVAGLRQRLARVQAVVEGWSGPGCSPWSGRSTVQWRARGAGDAGGRRGRRRARRPGCPAGPGALGADPGGGAPGGGVPALRYALRAAVEEARRTLLRRPELAGVEALIAVDASAFFSRPGPRLVDGVELLAAALHPERLPPPPAGTAVRLGPRPHQ